MSLNLYSKIEKTALYVLPFSLVFSIFIADLLVSILTIGFISKIFYQKKLEIFRNKFFKIFFIFWIYTLFISFFSEDIFISLKSAIPYFRFIFLPLIVYQICLEDQKFLKYFFISILSIFFILVIDGSIQFIYKKNIFGYISLENGRIQSLFKDEYILGSFILKIFLIISALIFYFEKNKNKSNYIFFLIYIISLYMIIISGDRTPLFLFLIASFFIFFFIKINKIKKIFILVLVFIISGSFLYFNDDTYNRLVNKTLIEFGSEKGIKNPDKDRLFIIQDGTKNIKFLPTQQSYWITSLKIVKDKNIFGNGNRSFKFLCKYYQFKWKDRDGNDTQYCASHPHNYYFQLLVETGVLGFLIILSVFLFSFVKVFKSCFLKLDLPEYEFFIYLSIFINLWPIAQTGNFFNNWISILSYLPVGFLLYFSKISSSKNNIFDKNFFSIK